MIALLDEIARGRPQIVVNTSCAVEDLAGFGGADRFAMTRAAVVSADQLIVVCPPTPIGVARLIDRVADLSAIVEGKPMHVVVNKMLKGSYKRNEIAREIQRNFTPAGIHFVPYDQRVERCAWEGTLVSVGEFTKTIASTITPMIPKSPMTTTSKRPASNPRTKK